VTPARLAASAARRGPPVSSILDESVQPPLQVARS